MKSIYLIRHGENELQLNDPSLTDRGKKQAHRIKFPANEIDGILCSPTQRTVQTATIISQTLELPYQVHDLLKERVDFLDVPDLNYREFRKLCASSTTDRDFILPNGQSSYTSGLRLEYLILYVANIAGIGAIIVTHQGIIADYLRNKFATEVLELKFPHFDRIREEAIRHCSITKILVDGCHQDLDYLGEVKHLM